MIFCFDNTSLKDVGVIQIPRSKMGEGRDPGREGQLKKAALWDWANRHNGHFDKVLKNDYSTFRDKGAMNKEELFQSVHKAVY